LNHKDHEENFNDQIRIIMTGDLG